jgi:hypothetical protein
MSINLPLAARAHFRFAAYLGGDQNQELNRFYIQTFLRQDFGFLQRARIELPELDPIEQQTEWGKKITTAQRAISRGQFRKSLKYLELANESFPNNLKLSESIAILSTYLADNEKSAATWQRLADMPGVSEPRAIEAAIFGINYRLFDTYDKVDSLEVTREIDDFGAALEHALSHKLLRPIEHPEWDQEGPPPRNSFLVLNQPYTSDLNGGVESIPHVIGTLDCFGKQTDSAARFVWKYDAIPGAADQIKSCIKDFDSWSIGSEREAVSETTGIPYNLNVKEWLLPHGITPFDRNREVQKLLMRQLKEEWSKAPSVLLNGHSPKTAAKRPELQRKLKGILYCLQLEALSQQLDDEQFFEIWSDLELSPPETVELGARQVAELSPLELMTLRLESLTDQQLREVASFSFPLMLRPVLRKTLRLLMDRPDSSEELPQHVVAHQLGLLSTDLDESLRLLAQARSKANLAQFPTGNYLVDEFQFRLSRGITDQLEELLTVIYKSHIHEPEVAQRISQVLQRFGLAAISEDWNGERSAARAAQSKSPIDLQTTESDLVTESGSTLWLPD